MKHLHIAISFIWIGFVCAISFMEAWLKFQAPGITLPLGLGIGQLVFQALNLMECVFAVVILLMLLKYRNKLFWKGFAVVLAILCIQTLWLLPELDLRAEIITNNGTPEPSYVHFYYVFLEVLKVVFLGLFAIKQLKTNIK